MMKEGIPMWKPSFIFFDEMGVFLHFSFGYILKNTYLRRHEKQQKSASYEEIYTLFGGNGVGHRWRYCTDQGRWYQ